MLSLGFWLHFEASPVSRTHLIAVGIFSDLSQPGAALHIKSLAWMHWSPNALGTRTEFWFWHGCSGHRVLLEPERNYGFLACSQTQARALHPRNGSKNQDGLRVE